MIQTKVGVKAQGKVAREIKTARAFGPMPFTFMGTKPFSYGKTMEDVNDDYEYNTYYGSNTTDAATEAVEESRFIVTRMQGTNSLHLRISWGSLAFLCRQAFCCPILFPAILLVCSPI